MAAMYDFSATIWKPLPLTNIFMHEIPIKLDGSNYLLWRAAVLPVIRAYNSEAFVLGTLPCPPLEILPGLINPHYLAWSRHDSLLLAWLLSSLSTHCLLFTIGHQQTSHALWSFLQASFADASQVWVSYLLSTTLESAASDPTTTTTTTAAAAHNSGLNSFHSCNHRF